VADSFDAMTRPRPYRKHVFPKSEAIASIRCGAGSRFDPLMAEAFATLARDDLLD